MNWTKWLRRKPKEHQEIDDQKHERVRQCGAAIDAACEKFNCQLVAHVQIVGSQLNSAVVVHAK